nr:MAG: hypothetical protein DIU75_02150 [Mycolicibacterium hassiacum]
MSWLLVALIPVCLMLAMVGLQRIETRLERDSAPRADLREHPRPVTPAARTPHAGGTPMPTGVRPNGAAAAGYPDPRSPDRNDPPKQLRWEPAFRSARLADTATSGFPPRRSVYRDVNPEFRRTRHANRV